VLSKNERAKPTNVFFAAHAFARIEERAIVQEDVYWILETGSVEDILYSMNGEWSGNGSGVYRVNGKQVS